MRTGRVTARRVVSAAVVATFCTLVAVLAFAYEGRPTAELDLDDSGVWITRNSAGQLGRFNTQARALDGSLQVGGQAFDVQQTAGNVLLDNAGGEALAPVDPVRLAIGGRVPTAQGSHVASFGDVVAVLDADDHRLWVLPFEAISGFNAEETDPVATLPADAELAVSTEGTVFAASPGAGKLYTVHTRDGSPHGKPSVEPLAVAKDAVVQVSAVGDQVVVLDRSAGTLILPGGKPTAANHALGDGQLQQPSADADAVLVGTPTGLITQPLDGGEASVRSADGNPAAPVRLDGCVYAAWSGSGRAIRDCPGTDRDQDTKLSGIDSSAQLIFRVNRHAIVLNDAGYGSVWLAAEQFQLVNDWDEVQPVNADGEDSETETTTPDQVDQFIPDRSHENRNPEPKDDTFGVRAGRTTILPVLANDIDPDGDVITATPLTSDTPVGQVQRILGGQGLQIVVGPDAAGTTTFSYEVIDGRGGRAEATVTVDVVPENVNNDPVASGNPALVLGQRATGSIKVLPYFTDPDGDDLFLVSATTASAGDVVEFDADGTVKFTEGGTPPGRRVVNLVVSDGRGGIGEGVLSVDVSATDLVPVAVNDHVVAAAGEPTVVLPLDNDRDPGGAELRLASVADAAGAEITPNYDAGTFTFVASEPGSYDVPYEVTNGPGTILAIVRVDVLAPTTEELDPIVVADTALLGAGGSALVDVLANDEDPAGGVLVVQNVQVPDDAGLVVSVLSHHVLRITATRNLVEPVTLTYTASNGTRSASGQVRVVPVAPPDVLRPPDAEPDEATVHTNDVVDVEVLRNDSHPDALPLTLADELESDYDPELGEAFVSEDKVRFRAGTLVGTAHLTYRVVDSNGQEDSALVTIRIRGGEENDPPQPPDLEARVLAGQSVRVIVPLGGVDPDGDSVTLSQIVGQGTKGTARVDDGAIEYEAAAGSTGVDTITYAVADRRGEVATATLRVGIALPSEANQPPVAVDDRIQVRPGRTVGVSVLDNDSDPDGDTIGIAAALLEDPAGLDPEVHDHQIVVRAPEAQGSYAFYYGIEDPYGAQASAAVTLDVSDEAPLQAPVARDDHVGVEQILGKTSVSVAVLDNDDDADGLAGELTVSLDAPTATVEEDGTVTVTLTTEPQILTYTVTDVDALSGHAFIHVPGLRDQRPVLKPGLAPVKAVSGEPTTIDLTDYVLVRSGRSPKLTTAESVKAVKGVREVTGETTIVYTSQAGYTGAASVSFEVTDGKSAEDSAGAKATLVLPLEVVPVDNEPPTLSLASAEVAAGETESLDLARYALDPDGDPLKAAVGSVPDGLRVTTRGTVLQISADAGVAKGTVLTLPVTIADADHPPVAGSVTVTVVGTTKPLPVANPDLVPDGAQGKASVVDVTANDVNPFPATPLKVVGAAAVETGRGIAAVRDGKVVVTPDDSFTGAMVVRYTIEDATGDAGRHVDGRIQVTVRGKPDAPATPQIQEVRSHTVVLTWAPPNNNGAPITEYVVTANGAHQSRCATTTCTIDGLTNDVDYTFTVAAVNDVGSSAASPASASVRPDERPDPPAAPQLDFGDGSLTVTWSVAAYTDRSPIRCVTLEISPAPAGGGRSPCLTGTTYQWTGLTNGTGYRVRAIATNAAASPSDPGAWSVPDVPAGRPGAPGAPSVARTSIGALNQITVSWTAPPDNGATITRYTIDAVKAGQVIQSQTVSGTARSVVFSLPAGTACGFRVQAHNRASDRYGAAEYSEYSAGIRAFAPPGLVTNLTAVPNGTSGQLQLSFGDAPAAGVYGAELTYQYDAGTGWRTLSDARVIGGLTDGTTYQISVRGVADVEHEQAFGPAATAAPARPYGPARAPAVSGTDGAAASQHATVRWSDPGTAGLNYHVETRVDGGGWKSAANSGSQSVGSGYDQTIRFCARSVDELGRTAEACTNVTTGSPPPPRVTLTKGDFTRDIEGCTNNGCWRLRVAVANATPNTTFKITCASTRDPGGYVGAQSKTLDGRTIRTNADGNFDGELHCAFGRWYGNNLVWVSTPFGDSEHHAW